LAVCSLHVGGALGPLTPQTLENILLKTKAQDILALSELKLPNNLTQLNTIVAEQNRVPYWKPNNKTRSGAGIIVSARIAEMVTHIQHKDHSVTIKLQYYGETLEVQALYGEGYNSSATTAQANQWMKEKEGSTGAMLLGDLNYHLNKQDAQGVSYRPWKEAIQHIHKGTWMEVPSIVGAPKTPTRWKGYNGQSRIDHILINRSWPWRPNTFQTLTSTDDFLPKILGEAADHRPIKATFEWEYQEEEIERKETPPNTRWWKKKTVKLFQKNLGSPYTQGSPEQNYNKLAANMEKVFLDLQHLKPKWQPKQRGKDLRWLRRAGNQGGKTFYSALKTTNMGSKTDSGIFPQDIKMNKFMENPKVTEPTLPPAPAHSEEPSTPITITMEELNEVLWCNKRKAGAGALPPFLFHILPRPHKEILRQYVEKLLREGRSRQ